MKRDWRYWLRLLSVGLAGGITLGYIVAIAIYVEATVRPAPSSLCCLTPDDINFNYETVTFTSEDKVTLSGWYIPSRNRAAVILLHGYGANRLEMLTRAEFLARHGYGVLLYDLRGHGESGGTLRTNGWLDVQDVVAALGFLQSREDIDPHRLGILGFSVGGQVALRAAAQNELLKAVGADGPSLVKTVDAPLPNSLFEQINPAITGVIDRVFEWRMGVTAPPGVVDAIPEIAPRAVLLIATGQDIMEIRIAENYYEHASDPKTLWQILEAGHGGGLLARPAEYEQTVITFFNRSLLESKESSQRLGNE
ncbi:MAG: alpha/beta hydrolase [Chloroflexota bacterium]|nr:MAG: alpha/beta hydrolase [Chloroflexota bacterium]